jgi:hypothetical protein
MRWIRSLLSSLGPRWMAAAAVAAGACGQSSYDLDGGDLVTVGKRFVDQRGCAACHQSPSGADGVLSGQSMPRPGTMAYGSNLTPDPMTGIGSWADIEIVRAMRYGIDDQELPLCPTMTHYDGTDPSQPFMTDLEAGAIVAYLRSLPAVARPDIPPSYCPPLKTPPGDMAMPATDDAAAPPVDLATPPDLAPLADSGGALLDGGIPADGAAGD